MARLKTGRWPPRGPTESPKSLASSRWPGRPISLTDSPAGKVGATTKTTTSSCRELPAGPRCFGDCATGPAAPDAPMLPVSRPAGRPKLNLLRRLAGSPAARGSTWMSGLSGPNDRIHKHSPPWSPSPLHACPQEAPDLCIDPLTFTYHGCPHFSPNLPLPRAARIPIDTAATVHKRRQNRPECRYHDCLIFGVHSSTQECVRHICRLHFHTAVKVANDLGCWDKPLAVTRPRPHPFGRGSLGIMPGADFPEQAAQS